MPRDNDKNNSRPPRRGRDGGSGRGRSGGERNSRHGRAARSSSPRDEKKFGERKFGNKKPFAPRGEGFRKDGDRASRPRFDRDDRAPRGYRPERGPRKDFGSRGRGEGRAFNSREDRPQRGERSESRPSRPGFGDKKFGDKRPYRPRNEGRGDPSRPRLNREDRPPRDEGPRFNRDERRGAPDSGGHRRRFNQGDDRGKDKPWEKREPHGNSHRDNRSPREGTKRFDRSREERGSGERPRFDRPRFDKPRENHTPRGNRSNRNDWQEHPRSERRERPRRDNEDDSKIFAQRPAYGGRGEYRERKSNFGKRDARENATPRKKAGERIAKIVSRAGLCSRREAEEWIVQGRVAVNGRTINSPALDITANDVVTIDGKPLPERERTRLFLYHKPRGLMTTHSDPEGRPTVFDNLPPDLPRLISIGRLDFNTEGLLLLTNDGGLARSLELPDTGWLRRYRVRAHGEITQAQLDVLKKGVEVDGVKYGSIDATLEHDKSSNVWIVFAIREGKNREVRNVMAHLGLEVNRLIRISYGPFQLGEIEAGQVEEVKTRVLREQLGDKIVAMSGAKFDTPTQDRADLFAKDSGDIAKRKNKSGLIADRKGRRILVTRAGSEEARARNEDEASGYGPPRRPTRGYKGKRDLKPRED